MTAGQSTRNHGFTLVEALIGLAILAALTVAVIPALRGASAAHARLSTTANVEQAQLRLEQVLREVLQGAINAPLGADGFHFTGTAAGLSLVTRPAGAPGLLRATLDIAHSPHGDSVSIALASAFGGEGVEETLATGLSEVRLIYYGSATLGEAPRWYQDWDGPHTPRLVVLDMGRRTTDGALRRIEAGVGGQASMACDNDSGRQACREGL